MHVTPGGKNLRPDAVIDYKTSQVTAEDLWNIFSGTVTDRTPEVIQGSPGTNVFLFWSGHSARNKVLKWADENLEAETFRGILEAAQGNYRNMLAVMETCYSGSIGTYCEGLPGVLLLCSASSGETSHADVMEDGIYLSNRFTRFSAARWMPIRPYPSMTCTTSWPPTLRLPMPACTTMPTTGTSIAAPWKSS